MYLIELVDANMVRVPTTSQYTGQERGLTGLLPMTWNLLHSESECPRACDGCLDIHSLGLILLDLPGHR